MRKKSTFGKAFPDQFKRVKSKYHHFSPKKDGGMKWEDALVPGYSEETDEYPVTSPWAKIAFSSVLLLVLVVLLGRLFHLQVVQGKNNRDLADYNRIQVKVIHAPRGVIYDRQGTILAQNEPGFRLVESSASASNRFSYISRDEAIKMEIDNDPRFKGLEFDSIRTYPLASASAHILGYVGEITAEELKMAKYKGYNPGDKVGRGGIEETYEKILRGTDGGEIIEVDAQGNKLRTLRETPAIPGQNLYLTIDAGLQMAAQKQLEEAVKKNKSCCGSVIAQDPRSGEILALVSYPSYNPKDISGAILSDNSPMLNRAIAGLYPPGSTFKIATVLAGLGSGKVSADTKFEDTGFVTLGTFRFSNWFFTQYGGKDEGGVNAARALQRSNDIYFYRLGMLVGEQWFADTARKLGMGKEQGIDIPGEMTGVIPDNKWKEENIGETWYPGDTLHMSIGQGFVLTTPLQISNLISTIAANGKQYPPHLAWKITDHKGKLIKHFKYDNVSTHGFNQKDIDTVKEGLSMVTKAGGTAWPFFTFPIPTAGKTGTAEFGDLKKTHAWYTGYAPEQSPEIAVTAMVEGGGEGSGTTGPIVKEVFRWYFSENKNDLIKDIAPVASGSARIIGE